MVSDETFFAWLDGELSADESARVEAEVAADPKLTELASKHRALQAQISGAFDPILHQPVPERLVSAARTSEAPTIDFARAKRARENRRWTAVPQWAAMAATLAIGVLVGTMVSHRPEAPVAADGGRLYAAAALDRALDTELASAPRGDVRIALTFRDQAGQICRTFTAQVSSGLACREDGRWLLKGLVAAPEAHSKEYRMAAGMDPTLATLVGSTIAGEPFDAAKERAARNNGWR